MALNMPLAEELEPLIEGEMHPLSAYANAAALLWARLPQINWVGFYFLHEGALWLGPFQGKVACTRIAPGRGVCGSAFRRGETIVVADVHLFEGHIACDPDSRSEIVIPLRRGAEIIGVLDVDSPIENRFSDADRTALEAVAALMERHCAHKPLSYSLT